MPTDVVFAGDWAGTAALLRAEGQEAQRDGAAGDGAV